MATSNPLAMPQVMNALSLGLADVLRQQLLRGEGKKFKSKQLVEIVVSDAVANMTVTPMLGQQLSKLTGESMISGYMAKILGTSIVLEVGDLLEISERVGWNKSFMKVGTDYILQYGINIGVGYLPLKTA